MTIRTHLGLGAEAILGIDYDYEGPNGCQRKLVRTVDTVFVYHQIGSAWVIQTAEGRG
jgi:hypothetical protein